MPRAYLVENLGARSHWQQRLRERTRRVLVAEAAAHRIVAYASWGPASWHGIAPHSSAQWQLYELYVQVDYREEGIGRRFCAEVARRLSGRGIESLIVEVLEGNPNRYFYEALGARLIARTHRNFAGRSLPTAIYLWTDLTSLAEHRAP